MEELDRIGSRSFGYHRGSFPFLDVSILFYKIESVFRAEDTNRRFELRLALNETRSFDSNIIMKELRSPEGGSIETWHLLLGSRLCVISGTIAVETAFRTLGSPSIVIKIELESKTEVLGAVLAGDMANPLSEQTIPKR